MKELAELFTYVFCVCGVFFTYLGMFIVLDIDEAMDKYPHAFIVLGFALGIIVATLLEIWRR